MQQPGQQHLCSRRIVAAGRGGRSQQRAFPRRELALAKIGDEF